MALNSHHLRKPTKDMYPCQTVGCKNYYKTTYRDANGMCVPCKNKNKERSK